MVPLFRIHHIVLVPLIVLSLPEEALFGFQILLLVILIMLGVSAMVFRYATGSVATSAGLLALIVWGKISGDLYKFPREDSAFLLLQFMTVIFFMEASSTVLSFDSAWLVLRGKKDDISAEARTRLVRWLSSQLVSVGKLIAGSFALSIGLLLVGGLVNISISQLAVNGVLVLAAVVAILILLTYKREPEDGRTRRVSL